MDIFEYAKTMNADYYDFHTGYIYHVQEYNRSKSFGFPVKKIRVSLDGETIGYVSEPEN